MNSIQLLSKANYPALFKFEQNNWDYFTQFIPARPKSYREYDSFCHAQDVLLREQQNSEIAFFILYNENDDIVARVNLKDIDNHSASLGYRVAESVTGQGIATQIVQQITEIINSKNIPYVATINMINAIVMNNNPASAKVLMHNGFVHSRTEAKIYEFQGQMMDFQHYQRSLKTKHINI